MPRLILDRPWTTITATEITDDIGPTIATLQAAGKTTLRAIAAGLNGQGIPTSRGAGDWTAVQVMRVLKRIAST